MPIAIDRRTLLVGGGIGIGLVVGFLAWPWRASSPLPLRRGELAFGAFVKIGSDGRVTVAVPQVETGQGIWTALPQLAAHELGAAWDKVAVEPAPLVGGYSNPLSVEWLRALGLGSDPIRITARSTSVRAFEQPFRDAGATARAMLIAAAAERWNVDPAECDTADGLVLHRGGTLRFGDLAEEAATLSPAAVPRRRARGGSGLAGKPLPRLDLPAKSDGSFRFAGDVRLPAMLYASARIAPAGARLEGFSAAAAKAVPGVRALADGDGWVAAAADSGWAAEQAMQAAAVRFSIPRAVEARASLEAALTAGEPETLFSRGDYDGAIEGSRPLGATYYAAPAQHMGLEPLSATARFSGGRLELWAATLAPDLARAAAAKAAGLDAGEVTLYPMPPGDGGGRALEADAIPLAVQLARRLERPVQLTLSQSASQTHGRPAPAALARMYALPGAGGPAAWRMRLATASGLGAGLGRPSHEEGEALLLEGAEPPYAIPNVRVDAVAAAMPFAAGYMRGEPHRALTFFTESFVDEIARLAGAEPLSFRMALLSGNPRLANCLSAAAVAGGWDGGQAGSTLGLAAASAFGSHVALLANATIGPDQRVKVHRLVAAVDCGRIANSGLVRQQIEGGLIWALGTATMPEPQFEGPVPLARSFAGLPRAADVPDIHVHLVASNAAPGGASGLGAAVLAPAVANAIFAATGKRLRNLPLDPTSAP